MPSSPRVVQGIVRGHPVPVGEPQRVGRHGAAVLVAVPRVVSVRPVLDVQDGVPEACLPERRVPRLRLRHAASHKQLRPQMNSTTTGCRGGSLSVLLGGQPFLVSSVTDGDVDRSGLVWNRRA